ncbi:MAG: hypothetical protein IJ191_05650 [Treponema sp.]|nr:hypothetical protein [Treponema sp.]
MIQKYFENWELDIEDTYAIVKNTIANTTVNFSDIKSYKETKGTVTYRLGFVKRFYIHWETYENSDELKKQLDAISSKIGTFEKHETTESIKTGVRCSQTYMIFIIGIVVVIAVVKILERLC